MLEAVLAEIEAHVGAAGWDQRPALFALVPAGRFTADDPVTAARLGIDAVPPDTLTPIEQEDLPDQPLDEVLGGIGWPESVLGCVVSQEILVLPPSAEGSAPPDLAVVAGHPQRREARLVAGVLRDGAQAVLLRLRGTASTDGTNGAGSTAGDPDDDLLTGPDLAPNLTAALLATFA